MNKKKLSFLLLAVLFTLVYAACKKTDEVKKAPENQAYFPLEIGKYIVYNVDSTIWDDTNCVESHHYYQMRYKVADTFTDAMGRPSKRIEISIRTHNYDPWKTPTNESVIYVTNTGQELEMVQSGFRFIKMTYPVSEGKSWQGNTYINTNDADYAFFKDWTYRYINVGMPNAQGDVNYNNTASVIAVDQTINNPETQPLDSATRAYGKEVFAPNIGMVYREYYRWTYDPAFAVMQPNNVNYRCKKGTGVVMKAVDHN